MGIRWSENLVVGSPHRLIAHGPLPDTCPLCPRQESPTCHVQIPQPQPINGQWVFFASPRYRTLAHPKIRLIAKNACSTFARTFDVVRFQARSVSLSGRWRWAWVCTKRLAMGACCRRTSRCRYTRHHPTLASLFHAATPVIPACHAHSLPSRPLSEAASSGCPPQYAPSCRSNTDSPSSSDAAQDPAPSCDSSSNWGH